MTSRVEKNYIPDDVEFLTKPQIALVLIDQVMASGITVKAWTFDELYGRDGKFLDGLDERQQAFVGEVPPDFHAWLSKPKILRKPPRNAAGRPKKHPRLARRDAKARKVRNLAKHSSGFHQQQAQRYRIRDSHTGPEVWDIQWHTCWRKTHNGRLISRACTLIVARNVRTGEIKYFLSNRVPGRDGWTLRAILRVAFGRWHVEACFREAKKELGWDHFECRGWRCVHRHLNVAILSQLFCARVRQTLCPQAVVTDGERLTMEQVRRAVDVYIAATDTSRFIRQQRYQAELGRQHYYQTRNAAASRGHWKSRIAEFQMLGIDIAKIKSLDSQAP